MPLVADDLHRPTFADWFWWAVMTAASGVLGLVLYVLLQGEMQGFSVLWSCAPLAAAFFGCPLRTHTKLLFAPVAAPVVFAPAFLVVPFYLLEPKLAAQGYALQHPVSVSTGSRVAGLWAALPGLGDDRRIAQLRTLQALSSDPAVARRVKGCQLLAGPGRTEASALSAEDLDQVIACAMAAR